MKKALIAGTIAAGLALAILPALAATNVGSSNFVFLTNNSTASSTTGGNGASASFLGTAKNITGDSVATNSVVNVVKSGAKVIDHSFFPSTTNAGSTNGVGITNNSVAGSSTGGNSASATFGGKAVNVTGDSGAGNSVTNVVKSSVTVVK